MNAVICIKRRVWCNCYTMDGHSENRNNVVTKSMMLDTKMLHELVTDVVYDKFKYILIPGSYTVL